MKRKMLWSLQEFKPWKGNMFLRQGERAGVHLGEVSEFRLGRGKDLYGKDSIDEITFELDLTKWKEFWQVAK